MEWAFFYMGLRPGYLLNIPTTKWFGTPNHFESSIYSREKVWQSPNLFGSGINVRLGTNYFLKRGYLSPNLTVIGLGSSLTTYYQIPSKKNRLHSKGKQPDVCVQDSAESQRVSC